MLPDAVTPEVQASRTPNYDIAPLLLDRWSPRSMTSESLTDEELFPLLEAHRWAPSSFNVPRRAHIERIASGIEGDD
jgi:nitroreductase